MHTLHPVLKHGGLFSDWEMLPRAMFAERVARIQAAIAAAGDDAWLVYGDAQRYGDVAYVSHFVPRLRSVVVLVPRSGEPTILASIGSRDVPASKILTWLDDLRPFTRLPGEAVKLIEERGLGQARIGLVGTRVSLPIAEWDAIAAGLPNVRWIERDAEYAVLRRVKDGPEDGALRRAAAAVRAGLDEAERAVQSERTQREATAQIDRVLRYAAAEDIRILIASGAQSGVALRLPDERRLAAGDTVLLFLQVEVQRYWAQGARTLFLGTPSAAARALADQAARAVTAMTSALRGGVGAAEVAAAARTVLGPERFAAALRYGLGGGIGLDAQEPPTIGPDSDERIPADGAIALHVVVQADGNGALAADTVLLRDGVSTSLLGTAGALA